jgi:hypothetical protein
LVDRQICFRLADAVPAASPPGPFRLGDAAAEALRELLQVFACGEESVARAFAYLGSSPVKDAARRGLADVADQELMYERLLRGMRGALPPPAPDRELRRTMLRFYHGIAQAESVCPLPRDHSARFRGLCDPQPFLHPIACSRHTKRGVLACGAVGFYGLN